MGETCWPTWKGHHERLRLTKELFDQQGNQRMRDSHVNTINKF